jgi:hypothetical protein
LNYFVLREVLGYDDRGNAESLLSADILPSRDDRRATRSA